jgi:hypothetical protein
VAALASIRVVPFHAQVALLDAGWQSYPQWEDGTEPIAISADGLAVGTRSDVDADGVGEVVVDVIVGAAPDGMRLVHRGSLAVGSEGIVVGSGTAELVPVAVPSGDWSVDVCVDGDRTDSVGHVVFALRK